MRTDRGFSENLLGLAMKKGASMAEVYQAASRRVSADSREGKAEAVGSSTGFGYCLRVIKDGRLGFSYSTDREEAESVAEAALQGAEFTEWDGFLDLPDPRKPLTPKVYDPEVEGASEDLAAECAAIVERAAFSEDSRITKIRKASVSFSTRDALVLNSKGVCYGFPSTMLSAHIMAVAEEGVESQMGWEVQAGRFLAGVKFEEVGSRAAKRALRMLGARRINATRAPVLLDSLVATEFLSVFASMLSSESVQKKKSMLRGRLGTKVISGLMDVVDDGLLEGGAGTVHVDDEGVPVSRKELINEGVLKGFLHNTRTARKDGVESTGNAVRGGPLSLPGVGPTNLCASTRGEVLSPEEMLPALGRGLHVLDAMGIHTANPVSGDFSIGVSGLWVDGGRPAYPVKEAVISGNLLAFFSGVQAVGSDLRFYGNIGSPSILMGPADISA